MIKFRDYLTELFDKPLLFVQIRNSIDLAKYMFTTVSGYSYFVEIENIGGNYEIAFSAQLSSGLKTLNFEAELKGNATKVISTVAAICELYFTKHTDIGPDGDVNSIYYIALESSRIKLYNAVIKKFLNDHQIPYQFSKDGPMGKFKLFP